MLRLRVRAHSSKRTIASTDCAHVPTLMRSAEGSRDTDGRSGTDLIFRSGVACFGKEDGISDGLVVPRRNSEQRTEQRTNDGRKKRRNIHTCTNQLFLHPPLKTRRRITTRRRSSSSCLLQRECAAELSVQALEDL
jgi:hypothetical protein